MLSKHVLWLVFQLGPFMNMCFMFTMMKCENNPPQNMFKSYSDKWIWCDADTYFWFEFGKE